MNVTPPDWAAISKAAAILKMRVVVEARDQFGDQASNAARAATRRTGRLHVAIARRPGRASRRIVHVDTEPLADAGNVEDAQPRDPHGLRTLSFAAGFRSGGNFAVVNLDRLEAALADPTSAPAWHRSVWAEILCPTPQAVAVAAASIAAVETEDSSLVRRVSRGLFIDRGLTEAEAARAGIGDGGLGDHLDRVGLEPDALVGVGRSGMVRPR